MNGAANSFVYVLKEQSQNPTNTHCDTRLFISLTIGVQRVTLSHTYCLLMLSHMPVSLSCQPPRASCFLL